MDRESAITLAKGFYFSDALSLAFMEAVVRIYLIEKGYEMRKIDIIEHYERKFNIYKLWSAPNPLNNQGQEIKVILIF